MNAVMIMCHKNIEQVLRLVRACESPETVVILHIDKKYDLDAAKLEELTRHDRVYLTGQRLSGVLDTRSLVDIAMLMVKKAKEVEQERGIHFRYYLLLSGQDYLIKPISYINNCLRAAYPEPLIDCTPHAKTNWIYHKFRHCPLVYAMSPLVDGTSGNLIAPVRLCLRVVRRLLSLWASVFHLTDYHRFRRQGIDIYGGSAWWMLPDVAMDYILSEYDANPGYVSALLGTNTPEETFFQIMTMRSPVKELVHINPPDMVAQHCKTWAYFTDVDKPFTGHPYIFTVNEYDRLVSSDFWIARKFDTGVDSRILDMLDTVIRGGSLF